MFCLSTQPNTYCIVLCGVPGSGKTTVGKAIEKRMSDDNEYFYNITYPKFAHHYFYREFLREINIKSPKFGYIALPIYISRDKIRIDLIKKREHDLQLHKEVEKSLQHLNEEVGREIPLKEKEANEKLKALYEEPVTDKEVTVKMYNELAEKFNLIKKSIVRNRKECRNYIIIDGCFTNKDELEELNGFLKINSKEVYNCFITTSVSDFYVQNIKTHYYLNNNDEFDYSDYNLNNGEHNSVPKVVFERKIKELKEQIPSLLSMRDSESFHVPTFIIATDGFVRLTSKIFLSYEEAFERDKTKAYWKKTKNELLKANY